MRSKILIESLTALTAKAFVFEVFGSEVPQISEWWEQNRASIEIYYFPFNSQHPIMGVFLEDGVAINSKVGGDLMKVFIALHESRHLDQHRRGVFNPYFMSVMDGDEGLFLKTYAELEKDANDYAIAAMTAMGFGEFASQHFLRHNELAGRVVFKMMSQDIRRYHPKTFFDLLRAQI